MNVFARMGFGCVAGAAATYVMDAVTEIVYTEDIVKRERAVQATSATQVLATKILQALDLNPTDKDAEKIAPLLHWSFGIASGMLAGFLAGRRGASAAFAVAAGMFLFDEVGLSLLGTAPPASRYPWQTTFRSALGHAAYAHSLAMGYEALTALARSK